MILAARPPHRIDRARLQIVLGLAAGFGAAAAVGAADLSLDAPRVRPVVEAVIACAAAFGALVIGFFAIRPERRLAWVTLALVVLGCAAVAFGVVAPLAGSGGPGGADLAAWLLSRTVVAALLALAFVPARPRRPGRAALVACLAAIGGVAVAAGAVGQTIAPGGRDAVDPGDAYWAVAAVPLALTVAAASAAALRERSERLPRWVVLAMAFTAASQVVATVQPASYTGDMTGADALRLAFAVTVAVGATLELRRAARERQRLLDAERRRADELHDLAEMRSEFPAMVAHELASPLAVIRGMSGVLGRQELGDGERSQALARIEAEAAVLSALSADMETAAARGESALPVRVRAVGVRGLVRDIAAFGRALPGRHEVRADADDVSVRADPERLAQVLRNLVANAAKYSAEGAPILLQARRTGTVVRFAVVDRGMGVHPDEADRIFEKFARGGAGAASATRGVGLGLHVCRRIVRAHGSELTVTANEDGPGSTFAFTLEAA